jgi:phage terminase large subunit
MSQINLDRFNPRPYQESFLQELFKKREKKRYLLVWPRRSGKDLLCFWACILQMVQKPTQVYFIYPTYNQGRMILWQGLDNEGYPIMNYLPPEVIDSKRDQDMSIRLKNGSFFKVVGSEDPDRLVGTNASFMVFSEYALQNPIAWQFLRQVVRANAGTAIFISTPRGKNHCFDLYEFAKNDPEWFVSKLTLDDTKHISLEDLKKERASCSEDLIQQEWFTSFTLGVEGSYYSKYLNNMRLLNQISHAPWVPHQKVHVAIDIGYADSTALIFFQSQGNTLQIIDYHEKTKEGLDYYAKFLQSKPYTYGTLIAPHDLGVTEWGAGMTRLEQARSLGLNFVLAPRLSVDDGIEAVRNILPRCWIDERNCSKLIQCLENYRQEFDEKRKVYNPKPRHDQFSHGADAFRYMAISQHLIKDTISSAELDNYYIQAQGRGGQDNVPKPFQQPNIYGSQW